MHRKKKTKKISNKQIFDDSSILVFVSCLFQLDILERLRMPGIRRPFKTVSVFGCTLDFVVDLTAVLDNW